MNKIKTSLFAPTLLAMSLGMTFSMPALAQLHVDAAPVGAEGEWWNNYQLTIKNTSATSVELKGATIQFDSMIVASTPSWAATGVSYPKMSFTSVAQGDTFRNELSLSFDEGSWVNTTLPAGSEILLTLGVSGQIGIDLVRDTLIMTTKDGGGELLPELDLAITSPTADAVFIEGQSVTLSATVSAINTETESVTFYIDGTEVAKDTAAPYQSLWTAKGEGVHTVKAIVVDKNGLKAEHVVSIQVKAEDIQEPAVAPTVKVTSPVAGTSYFEHDVITITANAQDEDGDLDRVEFWLGERKLGQVSKAPFNFMYVADQIGELTLAAKAIDKTGLTATDSVKVLVEEAMIVPQPPVIALTSPRDGQTVFIGKVMTLGAEATDVNDDLTNVEFFVSGVSVGSASEMPFVASWTPVTEGAFIITAIATDAEGHKTTAASVTVQAQEAGNGNLSCDIKQVYRADGSECMGDDHPRRIIGYYTSWRTGKNGLPSYLAHDLPWEKLTHINYAFAGVAKDSFELTVDDSATKMTWEGVAGAEMDPEFSYKGHFNLLSKFKKQYPDVKTLISVGGWAETTNLYPMTTNLATCEVNLDGIKAFNQSAVEFIRQYGFDGVDIDYEYPSSMKDSGNPNDFELSNKCRGQLWPNYMEMMTQLRTDLDKAGKEDGRRYMLTIASPSSAYLLRGMEDFGMQDVLDYVNIMSYDLHGTWNEFVGPQAALFDDGKDAELAKWGVYNEASYQGIGYLNQAWTHHFFRGAFKPSQINMGIPYYTRGWQGVTGGDKGLWGKAVEPNQSTCPAGTTVCGWGAEGTDNIWHDSDANGNEIKAGVVPMWHAMNLANATKLGIDGMPSYGEAWGLDPNNPKDLIEGEYERVWSNELQTAWLWNESKKVFLSIEDKESLKPKLDYIVDNGLGGMMVWEMAGDYSYDAVKREYKMGTDMTDFAHDVFTQATPMDINHNNLPAPDSVIDVTVSTTDWPEGDSNYPINPTLVFKNHSSVAIPGGSTIEFLMPTSTGDIVKDWTGAGLKVIKSGHTGSNFTVDGERKLFHTVAVTLRASESIPAGGEYTISMVYYTPVSGVANGIRFNVGSEVVGLKKDFPTLAEFEGGEVGTGPGEPSAQGCAEQGLDISGIVSYPTFPNGDHASGGQQIIHNNMVWAANWWTSSEPSSADSSWKSVCKITE